MALLDDVFDAHGGIDRWHGFRRFAVYFSIKGQLLACKGRRGALNELAAEGCTRSPSLRLTGFPGSDQCVVYRPDRAIIETLSGTPLADRENPLPYGGAPWDDVQVGYFCGLSIWNCLAAPFLLGEADVKVEELAPWAERGEMWRRVRALCPASLGMAARELLLYFDRSGWQRRADYAAIGTIGTSVAQYSWAHQTFSGIVVPTLYRSLVLRPDGTVVRRPAQVEIEIFDAAFE